MYICVCNYTLNEINERAEKKASKMINAGPQQYIVVYAPPIYGWVSKSK